MNASLSSRCKVILASLFIIGNLVGASVSSAKGNSQEGARLNALRTYILWRHPEIPQDALDKVFARFLTDRAHVRNREVVFLNDLTKPRDVPRFFRIEMQWDPAAFGVDMSRSDFGRAILPKYGKIESVPTPVQAMNALHGFGSVLKGEDEFYARYAMRFGNEGRKGLSSLGAYITGAKGYFVEEPNRPRVLLYGLDSTNSKAYTRRLYFHPGTDGKGRGWKESGTTMNGNSAGCIVVALQDYEVYEKYLDQHRGTLMFNWYQSTEQKRYMAFDTQYRVPALQQLTVAQQTQDYKLWQSASRQLATPYAAQRNLRSINGVNYLVGPPWDTQ